MGVDVSTQKNKKKTKSKTSVAEGAASTKKDTSTSNAPGPSKTIVENGSQEEAEQQQEEFVMLEEIDRPCSDENIINFFLRKDNDKHSLVKATIEMGVDVSTQKNKKKTKSKTSVAEGAASTKKDTSTSNAPGPSKTIVENRLETGLPERSLSLDSSSEESTEGEDDSNDEAEYRRRGKSGSSSSVSDQPSTLPQELAQAKEVASMIGNVEPLPNVGEEADVLPVHSDDHNLQINIDAELARQIAQ
nr:hypothetical protein Iba_chr09aCG15480 [Ipomoea batatas]